MAQQPWWDKASSFSRIHDHTQVDTPQSVGLLWTSDQPDAETWQNSQEANILAPGGIRTHNPNKRAAAGPHALDRAATGIGNRYFTKMNKE